MAVKSLLELIQVCLDRIDAIDPKVHAFLYIDREGALAQAADVDARRAARRAASPRAPIAVKDKYGTGGVSRHALRRSLRDGCLPTMQTVVEHSPAQGWNAHPG